jgi:hypothetical protein
MTEADDMVISALKRQITELENQVKKKQGLFDVYHQEQILKGQCLNISGHLIGSAIEGSFTNDVVAKQVYDLASALYKEAKRRGWPEFVESKEEK